MPCKWMECFILVTEHGLEYLCCHKRLRTLLSPQAHVFQSLEHRLSFSRAPETGAHSWSRMQSALCRFSQRAVATRPCSWLVSSWSCCWCQHTVLLPVIERLARMALSAPPDGDLACLTFIHNLIRRRPKCDCLLHRPSDLDAAGSEVDVHRPN
jgi:CBF/Mak21 family